MGGNYENTNYDKCKKLFKDGKVATTLETKNPTEIQRNMQVLREQLPVILDEFKSFFVLYNTYPESNENRQIFANIKSILTEVGAKSFSISNDIQANTNIINEKLICLNLAISKEKEKNRKLKIALGRVDDKNNASTELVSDYQRIYEMGYLRNFALFISIIVVFVIIKKMFSDINGEMNPKVKSMGYSVGNSMKRYGSNMYSNMKNLSGKNK